MSSVPAISLWGQPRFWLAQLVWWGVTYAIILARDFHEFGISWIPGADHYVFSFLLTVAFSSLLGSFYLFVPERWLRGMRSIPVVAAACLIAGATWTAGDVLHLALMTDCPEDDWRSWLLYGPVHETKLFVAWSVFFVVILQAKRTAELRARELQSEALAHEAELRSLRSQLNPSFFFDVIDSVSRAIGRDPEYARALLRTATKLLRKTLKATRSEMSSLGDTLDFEAHYLRFEALRRGGRLRYRVDASDALQDLPVPSLLIHPFVEHAVARAGADPGSSRLEIRARAASSRLEVDIRRNRTPGEGVSATLAEPLDGLRGQLDAAYPTSGSIELLEDDLSLTTRITFDPAEHAPRAKPASMDEDGDVEVGWDLAMPGGGSRGRVAGVLAWTVDPSVLKQPRFWFVQVGAGLVIYTIAFGPDAIGWVDYGAPIRDVAMGYGFGLILAVACSALIVWTCSRFSQVWLARKNALPVLAGLCLLVCMPWTIAVSSAFAENGMWRPEDRSWEFNNLLLTGSVVFITWIFALLLASIGLQLRDTRERLLRSKALAHKAQLRSLRAQLNPHFLFNALSSVLPLIRLDPASARRMLGDLEHLMRRALETTRADGTTLREELDLVSQYLRCEATRFGDFLSFDVQVPYTLRGAPIPSMLLQPLIENAVKHGMVPGASRLRIEVSAIEAGGRLVLEVKNTGELTPPLPRQAASRKEAEPKPGLGTGLRIVQERLANRYPATASFDLFAADGWVVAQIAYDPTEGVDDPRFDATELSVAAE